MNPFEHGEVFVTEDGGEADLDFGHYERFTGSKASCADSTTTGKIFRNIIERERKGQYNGQTVQIVPHFVQEVHRFLHLQDKEVDFTICEVGGTVGDIEGQGFIESIRQMRLTHGADNTLYVHVIPIYHLQTTNELKSKPAQHSVQALLGHGIQPDFLCCRTAHTLPTSLKQKLATACNLSTHNIITSKDTDIIYALPSLLEKEQILEKTLKHFQMPPKAPSMRHWDTLVQRIQRINTQEKSVNIAVVGKYVSFQDTYRSVHEALWHAGTHNDVKVKIHWISTDKESLDSLTAVLSNMDGILIPGGFGARGIEEKIHTAGFACTHSIPFLGICLGMQGLILHHARACPAIQTPYSQEFEDSEGTPVITLLDTWVDVNGNTQKRASNQGSLRLGSFPITLQADTQTQEAYGAACVHERHRHRYHTNSDITPILEREGLIVSGTSSEGIVECVELLDHPFCVGVQFHPEFNSSPFQPHPLFFSFIRAAMKKN